ncbi:toll/interleukin-1 receptor domain-containing protein [Ignatzschineria indica]|uniref:toll/interleukin-1 receptor domain-containing protein n=1 Tax=Ignatzschineria indica TaxID=472583 RepID=UPI0025781CD0|nr:toll/interleukin-1 receptor domain-containing protein [Ignatzschineria indica]MDM1546228.1 toll/interleukin-1 receptor domain-containing protein [Ignatzschineria indica]
MYKSIQISNFSYVPYIAVREVRAYKEKIDSAYLEPLKAYLLDDSNEIFSADRIQEKLFPTIKDNDIFLSHAHKDEDDVIKLAIYLEKYGLNVFVDSLVWGNARDLLKAIDTKYCWQKSSKTYNYHQRNHTTANVYMILNTALHKMIDQSELFLFLGSETAVKVKDVINNSNKESVRSPWIYSELMFANQVQRRQKIRFRDLHESKISAEDNSQIVMDSALVKPIQFDYNKPDLDYSLSQYNFKIWLNAFPDNYTDYSRESFIPDIEDLRKIQAGKLLDSLYKEVENSGNARQYKR